MARTVARGAVGVNGKRRPLAVAMLAVTPRFRSALRSPSPPRGRAPTRERHAPRWRRDRGRRCVSARDTEEAVLHRIVRENLETFLREATGCADGGGLPRFVEREFREFLTCGVLARGFARVRCEGYAFERLVPFSCKRAASARAAVGAAWRSRRRTWSTASCRTSPCASGSSRCRTRLRYRLAYDYAPCRGVLAVAMRALLAFYRRRGARADVRAGQSGAVTVIQRFGGGLQLNVHFHSPVIDGVFAEGADGRLAFYPAEPPSDQDAARLLATISRRVRSSGAAGSTWAMTSTRLPTSRPPSPASPAHRAAYHERVPLGLPGAEQIRLNPASVRVYRRLTNMLALRCATFLTMPGINSLYLFTGKEPPTMLNAGAWMTLLTDAQEAEVRDRFARRRLAAHCATGRSSDSGLRDVQFPTVLSPHIASEFVRYDRWGAYELLMQRRAPAARPPPRVPPAVTPERRPAC